VGSRPFVALPPQPSAKFGFSIGISLFPNYATTLQRFSLESAPVIF
jgi:hypothetical protein